MKTPILDEFIEELQELKDGNFSLTKDLEERLIEFKNIKAAINYTHSCTELKDKEVLTFKEFVKTFIKTTVHNETYFYKNDEFNKIQKVKEIYNKKILNL